MHISSHLQPIEIKDKLETLRNTFLEQLYTLEHAPLRI